MSSFSAILSSLQDGKSRGGADVAPASTTVAMETRKDCTAQRSVAPFTGNKRKLDDDATGARKIARLSANTIGEESRRAGSIKSAQSARPHIPTSKPAYLGGSMKSKISSPASTSQTQSAIKQQKGASKISPVLKPQQHGPLGMPPTAQRGFASLLAKASAAQEAARAAGPDVIKHKVTEVRKKKDRERLKQEAKEKEKQARKGHVASSGTAYSSKGAIGQPVRRPKVDLSKVGTMRARPTMASIEKQKHKGLGQDRYGGYASWSDLSDAEEDPAEDYESESDMEEAGFDDVMEEEQRAARLAREEDQREAEDEERRRKEKLARQKKLLALSHNAAAAKKRY